MRRVVRNLFLVVALTGVALLGTGGPVTVAAFAAFAAPDPSTPAVDPSGRVATPGQPVCTLNDPQARLVALSGMAATETGYVMINDGTGSTVRDRVFFVNTSCQVTNAVRYPSAVRDPEDLALGRDGTIWVADIGDNDRERANVALWKVPPNGNGQMVLYRLRYPDGSHDAEALLLDANDQPIIVTKESGNAGIYTPTEALVPATSASQGVEMRRIGEFVPQRTGTSNWAGLPGQLWVTGGANSPDRAKVVVRTYSDAYEWDVPDGDVVKAITTGEPRITPLPDEPQGEAITYSRDGTAFLTVSDMENQPGDVAPAILQYTPDTAALPSPPPAAPPPRNTLAWYQRLSLTEVTWLIVGVGVLGMLLMLVGVDGIRRARRRARVTPARAAKYAATGARADADDTGSTQALAPAGRPDGYAGGTYYSAGSGYQPPGQDDAWPGGAAAGGSEYRGGTYTSGQVDPRDQDYASNYPPDFPPDYPSDR